MFLYLHGFASGPNSRKAQQFQKRFAAAGVELSVPALDEGDFEHLTLTRQLALVRRLTAGAPRPRVLIGSSMGGYLAALHASAHPVDALVLMAPAVDFARRLVERHGHEDIERWRRDGFTEVDHHALGRRARLARDLVDDAARHAPFPKVFVPTLVFQGRKDDVVPLALVERWAADTPSARLVVYDTGHDLEAATPALLEETLAFLAGLPEVAAAHPQLALRP